MDEMHTDAGQKGYYLSLEGAEFLNELWKVSGVDRDRLAGWLVSGRASALEAIREVRGLKDRIADLERGVGGFKSAGRSTVYLDAKAVLALLTELRKPKADPMAEVMTELRAAIKALEGAGPKKSWRDTPIGECEFSFRTWNCLKGEGIKTLGEAADKPDGEILRTPNFGRKSLAEVKAVIAAAKGKAIA